MDSSGATPVCFVGNLRSDIPKTEVKTKLKILFSSFGFDIETTNIEVKRKNTKKPTHAFVQLDDAASMDNAIARINGLDQASTDLVRNEQKLTVAAKLPPKDGTGRMNAKHKHTNKHKGPRASIGESSHAATIPYSSSKRGYRNQAQPSTGHESVGKNSVINGLNNGTLCSLPSGSANKIASQSQQSQEHNLNGLQRSGECYYVGQKLGTEDRLTEYKKGGGRYLEKNFKDHVGKYVCAFLNSEGGKLLVGVSDECVVRGVECGNREDHLRLEVDDVIKRFNPTVFTNVYSVKFIPVYKATCPSTATPLESSVNNSATVSFSTETEDASTRTTSISSIKIGRDCVDDNATTNSLSTNEHDHSYQATSTSRDKLIPSEISTSHSVNDHQAVTSVTTSSNLKVIEVSVKPPEGLQPRLYENDKGDVYIRRDGSIQGPLRASEILEWGRQHMGAGYQRENDSLKSQIKRNYEEIQRNIKLNDELVKQKEFIDDQHKLKVEEFRKREQDLEKENDIIRQKIQDLESQMQENLGKKLKKVPRTKSAVCVLL